MVKSWCGKFPLWWNTCTSILNNVFAFKCSCWKNTLILLPWMQLLESTHYRYTCASSYWKVMYTWNALLLSLWCIFWKVYIAMVCFSVCSFSGNTSVHCYRICVRNCWKACISDVVTEEHTLLLWIVMHIQWVYNSNIVKLRPNCGKTY